jgi:hypothetical protein
MHFPFNKQVKNKVKKKKKKKRERERFHRTPATLGAGQGLHFHAVGSKQEAGYAHTKSVANDFLNDRRYYRYSFSYQFSTSRLFQTTCTFIRFLPSAVSLYYLPS